MVKKIKQLLHDFEVILDKFPDFRYAGDPVLRNSTRKTSVSEGTKLGNKLGQILIEYRKITGFGRGLAAPQIGVNKSVFVTFVDDNIQIFINPKIVKKSKSKNFYKELCLSSGVMAADVKRSNWIVMWWVDAKGITHEEKFGGFLARLYQHEEAHLRGKLNIDQAVSGGIEFMLFDPLKEKLRNKK